MNATPDVNTPYPHSGKDPHPSSRPVAPASSRESADIAQRVAQGAHASIDSLQRSVQHGIEQARTSADQWSGSMREVVREHPLSALGGAFALGVIFARLMR